ncbi:MAG: hypothetical protein M1358_20970, partial [Chloroflexi bacterium]|nr:hypothetical protein [Chloroflexota bacterium]
EQCEACQHEVELLRGTVAILRTLPVVPVPRSFAIQPAPVKASGKWLPYLRGATALAAILLVLLVAGDVLSQQVLSGARFAAAPEEAKSTLRQATAGQAQAVGTTSPGLVIAPPAGTPEASAGEPGAPLPQNAAGSPSAEVTVNAAAPEGRGAAPTESKVPVEATPTAGPVAAGAPSLGTSPPASEDHSVLGAGVESSTAVTAAPGQPGGSTDMTNAEKSPGLQPAPSEAGEPGQSPQENPEVGGEGLSPIRLVELGLLALTVLLVGGTLLARARR